MFRKSINKLSSEVISERISQIKARGENLFGVMYSNYKRHSVYKAIESSSYEKNLKRKNAFDYINDFVSVVLPKVETFVETRMLEKFKLNLDSQERVLVEDAYRLRKYRALKQIEVKPEVGVNRDENTNLPEIHYKEVLISTSGEGFKFFSQEDIGKYVLLPENLRKEIYPFGFYGYYQKEFAKTNQFGLMIREESVKLARAFSTIKTHEERLALIDYEAIFNKRYDFKSELKNYETFSLFFQEIAYSLNKTLEKLNNHEYTYLFTNAEIFDAVVTILVRNLKKNPFNIFMMVPEARFKILEQIIKQIHQKMGNTWKYKSSEIIAGELKITEREYYPLTRFEDIIAEFKIFRFELNYKDMFDFADKVGVKVDKQLFPKPSVNFTLYLTSEYYPCEFQWRPQEMRDDLPRWKGFNTGALLNGDPGCGKSMILSYMHAWARENKWFVFAVNDIKKYTQCAFPIERHLSGLYIMPELATHLLRDVKIINYELLKEIPVDLSDYGNFDTAGNRLDGVEAVPTLWDEKHQVYTDSWKEHNMQPEEEIILEDYPHHNLKLIDHLPKPINLLELVEYGIKNEDFGTCIIAEVLNQLRKSEKYKTMILIDEYNELYKPTVYDSYKYANQGGKIPPYDFALLRMFMKFDGHYFKQGVKLCASSMTSYDRHVFKAESIHFPRGYELKVENLRLNDLRNAMHYYMGNGFTGVIYDESEIQEIYSLCQGNWKQMHHDLGYYFRMLPAVGHRDAKKAIDRLLEEKRKFR